MESKFQLKVNGKTVTVPPDLDPTTKLCDYLRTKLFLTGTKICCREGGCGACAISLDIYDPVFKTEKCISVNSCLLPLYSCNAISVTTVEGLGNRKDGYHPIQSRLAEYNGTQCGFCSPGFVMTMYASLENKTVPPVKDIESLLDGNICRCTGYRPIVDTIKSLVKDGYDVKKTCEKQNGVKGFKSGNPAWYHPSTVNELMKILRDNETANTKMLFGNTASGVFKDEEEIIDILIDLKNIFEMYQYDVISRGYSFGANTTLNNLSKILSEIKSHSAYSKMAKHINKIANTHVRNVGSWSGNLMMKYRRNEFPSDISIILEAIRAKICVIDLNGKNQHVRPSEFLAIPSMKNRIITKMILPQLHDEKKFKYESYKIMPRSQSVHAYVSAAFLIELDESLKIVSSELVYNGIGRHFIHAEKTEKFLSGKKIQNDVIQRAMSILSDEINPERGTYLSSADYRRNLAITLFYKFILKISSNSIDPRLRSACDTIERPISSGTQTYDTDKSKWPLYEPISKLEAKAQCSGEAEYIPDIPHPPGTLYGTFVISTIGNATLENIDATEATKLSGVLGFLTHKDILGTNNCVPLSRDFFFPVPEELFCSGHVLYAGQCLGLLVAETATISKTAAKKIKITYNQQKVPILTIKEALAVPTRVHVLDNMIVKDGDVENGFKNSKHVVEGEVEIGTQYHFHLETQVCLTIPSEDGFEVSTSTQWLDGTQQSIAQVLNVRRNDVHLQLRRLGGGYGGKVTRNFHTAAACALASKIFNRPVYVQMDLETNLEMLGKRNPFLAKYKVGVDDEGKLQAVKLDYFMDYGCTINEPCMPIVMGFYKNAYQSPNWSVTPTIVTTNLPSNTYCRTPGSVKGIFVMETVMQHVSKILNKNDIWIKKINMEEHPPPTASSSIQEIMKELEESAGVEERRLKIQQFNVANKWKKRGLAVSPMKYNVGFRMAKFNVFVSIYDDGGSVVVAHGGVECGQGINTKVAQVCAFELGIPIEMVKVRPTNTLTNPNASGTIASTTSEINCHGAVECCRMLLSRIQPVRDQMINPSWSELIHQCCIQHVDLCARYLARPPTLPKDYTIYGACCAEAEVDGLTGEYVITRVDLLFDCGLSISPEVDIGQIEGSFVMGMGLFLTEKVQYDASTGRNLTRSTWEYYPPTCKDIPADFRVAMLKNSKNPFGVLKSKTAGEPPLCMSCSVFFAIQKAVDEIRKEIGDFSWRPLNVPATPEEVLLKCAIEKSHLNI